jgi:hypothetical protein
MESCGAVLKRMVPEFTVFKQKLRQADGISLIRTNREERKQVLAFSSGPLSCADCPCDSRPKGNSCLSAGMAASCCRSPVTQSLGCRSGRIAWSLSIWPPSPFSRGAVLFAFARQPRCSIHLA